MLQKNERMGCLATATLSWMNPKTHELETVRFTPPIPEGYKPNALEARHQCAVYSLHRVEQSFEVSLIQGCIPQKPSTCSSTRASNILATPRSRTKAGYADGKRLLVPSRPVSCEKATRGTS